MYERRWKDEDTWKQITEAEAHRFAEQHYVDANAALDSVRDGCDLNTPFAWVRWVKEGEAV
jgi:hypothetical protein